MKGTLFIVGLLLSLATGVTQAQTRVGVSLSFGDPYFAGHVVIGRPYYRWYYRPYVYLVEPRYYSPRRVVIVRPHRYSHRYRRFW